MTLKLSLAVLGWDDVWPAAGEINLVHENVPVRFRIRPRGGLWEVCRGASFWANFSSRTEANDRVRAAMLDIFATGGSAQVRFT